jgi:hypothetical protein
VTSVVDLVTHPPGPGDGVEDRIPHGRPPLDVQYRRSSLAAGVDTHDRPAALLRVRPPRVKGACGVAARWPAATLDPRVPANPYGRRPPAGHALPPVNGRPLT